LNNLIVGFAAAFLLALVSVGLASARINTTSPGQHVTEVVLIQSQGITVGNNARLPRGVIVTFYVKNLTQTAKNFKIFGKTTPAIRPGRQAKLTLTLEARGVFPYQSTLHASRVFRGLFIVY